MNFSKLSNSRIFLTIFLSIIILFIIIPLSWTLSIVNEKIKSYTILNMMNYSSSKMVSDEIVVVTIDEKTYEKLWFPFSRSYYSDLIKNINSWWAEVIWFDIMFANNNPSDLEWDNKFADTIKEAWNIVLGSATTTKNFWWEILWVIEMPLEKFYNWVFAHWFYAPNIDKRTKIATSFFPSMKIHDYDKNLNDYNHFSISVLKAYYSKLFKQDYLSYKESNDDYFYVRPDLKIPFQNTNTKWVLINYIPLPDPSTGKLSNFKYYSFLDVLENKIDPKVFEWKIVLVWATAKWIKDTFITYNGIEYWVFVLANAINTVLTKSFLIELDYAIEFSLIFLLIILSVYFNLSRSGLVLIFSNLSITLIFLIIFPLAVIVFTPYLLNYLAHLFFALVVSLTLSNTVKYLIENKNKNKLNKALSEYVSEAIADEVLSNSWKINLDWEIKKLAIYFSDIEWFTTISEKFKPEELVSFLREYLSNMSDIIMDEKWFIDKYEWDAIMALWWSFIDYDKWWYHACFSALKQQERLWELNKKWSKSWFNEIKVRIGLHIWEAIVWNIWSAGRKMEYTALGDNVNLASRLEWVNKFYWTYICVSEVIYQENKEFFEFRYLDKIKVKWKNKPIKIYELLSLKWNLDNSKKEIVLSFENAVKKYLDRDFIWAKKDFENLKNLWDKPSLTYLDMCEIYIKNPPEADWEGISVMTSK